METSPYNIHLCVCINELPQILHTILISTRLVTLLKVTDGSIHVSDIFYLTVSFKFLDFSFHMFLLFVPEMSVGFTSYIV